MIVSWCVNKIRNEAEQPGEAEIGFGLFSISARKDYKYSKQTLFEQPPEC